MVLDIIFEGKAPIPRTGSTDDILNMATAAGWLTASPAPGDLYLLLNSPTDAHHVGFVTEKIEPTIIGTISGNTSADGTSSNGDRVAEHDNRRTEKMAFVHYPRLSTP
jgi:hypothetical protein